MDLMWPSKYPDVPLIADPICSAVGLSTIDPEVSIVGDAPFLDKPMSFGFIT